MKTILTLTAALLLCASLTIAQGHDFQTKDGNVFVKEVVRFGPGGHGGGGQCSILDCKEKLNLTDDQMTKLKALKFKHQNQMIDLKADLQKARLNMRNEHNADLTKSKALSLSKDINKIEGLVAAAKIEHQFAVKDILNKEQFDLWHKCKSGGMGGFGGHGGMGCGTSCGPGGKGGHGGFGSGKACGKHAGFGSGKACDKHGSAGFGSGKACDKHGPR